MSQVIVIPDERPPSWNKFYAGMHWAKRKEEADRVRLLVRSCVDPDKAELVDGLVDIDVRVYFDHHPQDSDNICSKVYIDGIKGLLIEDDDPEHIRRVSTASLTDKDNPRVEIEIREMT